MSASNSLTRGPLPPGVYWRRRIVVLIGAALLVYLIAHLLGAGGGSGGDPVAQQAGATVSTSAGTPASTTGSTVGSTPPVSAVPPRPTGATTGATGATDSSTPIVLAAPSGPCAPSDIRVTPKVDHAVVGSNIAIDFALETKKSAACTFQVTPHDLAVKIVRHGRVLWTSQQCDKTLPSRSVVVRNVVPSLVSMVWDGEVSTAGCRPDAGWVRPGPVTVWAATLGGPPGHTDVTLQRPGASSTSSATPTSSTTTDVSTKANPTPAPKGSATAQPRR